MKLIDITGQKFGHLTVVRYLKKLKWECLCDCGNFTVVLKTNLIQGKTKSCGCLQTVGHITLLEGESGFNKVFREYKLNSIIRDIDFKLSKEEFKTIQQQDCFYCGSSPQTIRKVKNNWSCYKYNGIDRVDNNIGYEMSNVVACCKQCNFSKSKYTQKEFIDWVIKVYNHSVVEGGLGVMEASSKISNLL
jgi:hypothetical protein